MEGKISGEAMPSGGILGSRDYQNRIKYAVHILTILLAASVIVFIGLISAALLKEGIHNFFLALSSIDPFYYAGAILVLTGGYLLRYPKWEMYMKKLGIKIPRAKNLAIYLSLYSMDITPGRWGRSVVSYTINRLTGAKFTLTFPAVVADIFTDFLGFCVILLASSFLVRKDYLISVGLTALLLIPFLFLYSRTLFEFIKKKLNRIRRMRGFLNLGSLYFKNNTLLDKSAYAYSMLFTIPSVLMNGLAFYLVILSFGVHVGISYLPTVLFIYYFSLLLGMVTGIPGTLGITDVSIAASLTLFFQGLGPSAGIVAGTAFSLASLITIFYRVLSLWFVEALGFSSLWYTVRYWKNPKK